MPLQTVHPQEGKKDRSWRNEGSFDGADGFDCCDYGTGCGYSGGLGDCDLQRRIVSEGMDMRGLRSG